MTIRSHLLWLGTLSLAILIAAGSGPALEIARNKAADDLAATRRNHAQAAHDLKQLRADVAEARKLGNEIDHNAAEQVLAPADRLKAAAMLRQEATNAVLARFSYTIAPEEHVTVMVGGEKQVLARSAITLGADLHDDRGVYAFLDHITENLPGRARVQMLSIERLSSHSHVLAAENVHFEAVLEWLSNGSMQTAAGVP